MVSFVSVPKTGFVKFKALALLASLTLIEVSVPKTGFVKFKV